jgi:hypothetical protein
MTTEKTMNRDKIIELLEDGAYLNSNTNQFFHPSFRKGWRKMKDTDISWMAVERVHNRFGTNRLIDNDGIITLNK